MTDRTSAQYIVAALILGVLALLNAVLLRHSSVSTIVAIFLYILILVVAYFGGQRAQRHGRRPGWFGALLGAVFGTVEGFGAFFLRTTRQDLAPRGSHVSQASVNQLLHIANSSVAHITAVITTMLTFGLFALVVGSIGGSAAKKPPDRDAV